MEVLYYPPASEASWELASLSERKNPPPLYGVKEFVGLSVIFLAGNNYPDWIR